MIEINLTPSEKQQDFTKIAGINLSLINVRLTVIFIVILYAINPVIDQFYSGSILKMEERFSNDQKNRKKLLGQLRKYDVIKKQVEDLNNQEKELANKIKIVKEIVDKRSNPFPALKYIANNTPNNVWVTELEIDDNNVKIVGYSRNWKSIGIFIENLKTSIFFDGNINYNKPIGVSEEISGIKVESFELKFKLVGR